eukprot:4208946-Prymnesium_polylepis.1
MTDYARVLIGRWRQVMLHCDAPRRFADLVARDCGCAVPDRDRSTGQRTTVTGVRRDRLGARASRAPARPLAPRAQLAAKGC